jgi:hypothetical protein
VLSFLLLLCQLRQALTRPCALRQTLWSASFRTTAPAWWPWSPACVSLCSLGSGTRGRSTALILIVSSARSPQLDVVDTWGPARVLWYLSYNRWAAEAMTIITAQGQVR